MTDQTSIVLFGAAGRMGRMILGLAAANPDAYRIVGAVDCAAHPSLGQPLAALVPGAPADVRLRAQPPRDVPAHTVAIHFSLPEATLEHLAWNIAGGYGAVIGTTGLSVDQQAVIERAAAIVPILLTPNTSRGVNVLFWLVAQAARLLGDDYDVEITEMHHHHKKDAPSGTARRLAEVVAEARGLDYATAVRHGREGLVGARPQREIGMHALRGGDVVGEHTVVFAGPHERIELTHRAHGREVFASGTLQAAAWLQDRAPGMYTMNDVLGL